MEINNQNYTPKYSLRSMFVFEEITGKAFEVNTLLDTYVFCYACLISNPDNPSLEFNTFIDWCESHPEVMEEFNEFMRKESRRRETMGGKKKVTRVRTKKS